LQHHLVFNRNIVNTFLSAGLCRRFTFHWKVAFSYLLCLNIKNEQSYVAMFMPMKEKKQEQADEVTKGEAEKAVEVMKKEKSPFKVISLGKAEKWLQDSKGVPHSKDIEKGRDAGAAEETAEKKGLRERFIGGITNLAREFVKDKTAITLDDFSGMLAIAAGAGFVSYVLSVIICSEIFGLGSFGPWPEIGGITGAVAALAAQLWLERE
jgi:hypothetical protein